MADTLTASIVLKVDSIEKYTVAISQITAWSAANPGVIVSRVDDESTLSIRFECNLPAPNFQPQTE